MVGVIFRHPGSELISGIFRHSGSEQSKLVVVFLDIHFF